MEGSPRARQLADFAAQLEAARAHLRRLAGPLDDARWAARPGPGRWSVGECVAHLNATSAHYLPRLAHRLEGLAPDGGQGPFRRDLVGRLFAWSMEPPVRLRFRAPRPFLPGAPPPREPALATFERLQDELVALLAGADSLPLDRVRVSSPVSRRVRFSLLSAVAVLAAHQRRHLWQAERALADVAAADNPAPPAT